MNRDDYKRMISAGSIEHGLRYNTHRRTVDWPLVVAIGLLLLVIAGHFLGGF